MVTPMEPEAYTPAWPSTVQTALLNGLKISAPVVIATTAKTTVLTPSGIHTLSDVALGTPPVAAPRCLLRKLIPCWLA